MPVLPSVRRLELVHHFHYIEEPHLALFESAIAGFFSLPVDSKSETTRYMTLVSPLFSHLLASPFAATPTWFHQYYWQITTFPRNWVTYRATLSDESGAWHGLDLEVCEEPDRTADEKHIKEVNELYKYWLAPQWLL